MSSRRFEKTAHYRVGEFVDNDEQHSPDMLLSDLLAQARSNYPDDNLPFSYGSTLECIVVSHHENNGVQLIHLVTFEKGAGAAVVSNLETLSSNPIDEIEPPENNEFIRSQLFLVCSNNRISWVSHNSPLTSGAVSSLIGNLLDKFHPNKNLPKLLLTAPINQEAFRRLLNDGIKSVELKTTAFKQQLEYTKEGGKVPATFSAFFESDEITEEVLDASKNLNQSVILSAGRARELFGVKVVLEKITRKLMEGDDDDDDDGFVIVTKQNHRLTKKMMTITLKIDTIGNSQTLDSEKTFDSLRNVFERMIRMAD